MKKFFKILGIILLSLLVIGIWGRYDAVEHPRRFIQVMNGYVDLVEGYTALAKDPTAAGVAASLGAKELLEQRPPEQAIAYFEQLLPEVRDDSVRRSVRVQLAELYKKTGQNEKALEQYRILMTEPATRPAADGQ